MQICKIHWDMMRQAVTDHGLDSLVHKDGKSAFENELKALEGQTPAFDPLMQMNWFFSGEAIRCGGLYLMMLNEQDNPNNNGHYCPVCEFEKHQQDFIAADQITSLAKQMQEHAREQGLIPQLS